MEVSVGQALFIALWIGCVMSRCFLGGATTTLRFTPMMTGLICGIAFGNVPQAMVITAAIQLIYMGVFSPGGQMPSEPAIAAGIAVPVALLGGLTPQAAIGVAVPVGLLGSYLYQFRFFVNTFIMSRFTDRYAKEAANSRKITWAIIGLPVIVAFLIFTPFMFITLYYGAPVIARVIASNSGSLLFHILQVIGGGLAAIGIAVTIYVIGKKNYIVFFLLAYFLAVIMSSKGVTMITYAVIGTLISLIFVLVKNEAVERVAASGVGSTENKDEKDDY